MVQAIVRLTHAQHDADSTYVAAVEGRIRCARPDLTIHAVEVSTGRASDLSQLVAEELAPYRTGQAGAA